MNQRIKAMLSGDFGSGKTCMALDYSRFIEGDLLTLDYERGQDYYLVEREKTDPKNLAYFAHRLVTPSLYEVRYIVEVLKTRKLPEKINHKAVDMALLSPETQVLTKDIVSGNIKIGAVVIDTVTRLCDITTSAVFDEQIERAERNKKDGIETAEKMSQLLWAKTKDQVSEVLFRLVETDVPFILTAWIKNKFDKETKQSTNELITDVLKNVRAFVDLELMLLPGNSFPVRAQVMKSRLSKPGNPMPKTITASWEEVLKYTTPVVVKAPLASDPKPVEEPKTEGPTEKPDGNGQGETLTCARCEGQIQAGLTASGRPYTAQELADNGRKKFTQQLCVDCFKEASRLQKAAAQALGVEVKAEVVVNEGA